MICGDCGFTGSLDKTGNEAVEIFALASSWLLRIEWITVE